MSDQKNAARYGFYTAVSVVIANMIGTGVFTSLGFQLAAIKSGFAILMLWAVGGVAALCGALSYAELGAALPRSGGEYNFLTRIYHPAAGFISGWVSASIGFAAPVALAAITFASYAMSVVDDDGPYVMRQVVACALVVVLAAIHAGRRSASGGLQKLATLFKVLVIVGFCFAAIVLADQPAATRLAPAPGDASLIASGAFAVSLIYVSYAFNGWNAATYLSDEIDEPQRNIPRILAFGTLVVMLLYVALNAVFLRSASMASLVGRVEVGFIAAQAAFGEIAADFTGLVMASLLISTVSAMTIAGPRVLQVIGQDFAAFRRLAAVNKDGIPSTAIYIQSAVALIFIITSSFDSILVFAGFATALNTFFAVLGLFVLRWREPDLPRPFKTIAYPLPPLVYLSLTGWTLAYVLKNRPVEGAFALGLIAVGFVLYFVSKRLSVRAAARD